MIGTCNIHWSYGGNFKMRLVKMVHWNDLRFEIHGWFTTIPKSRMFPSHFAPRTSSSWELGMTLFQTALKEAWYVYVTIMCPVWPIQLPKEVCFPLKQKLIFEQPFVVLNSIYCMFINEQNELTFHWCMETHTTSVAFYEIISFQKKHQLKLKSTLFSYWKDAPN